MAGSNGASKAWDAVVIGGGHNGLITAAYLAKAGLRTLVLERREHVGGAAETSLLAKNVRVPRLAHTVGRLRASVHRDLDLKRHGLTLVGPAVRVFAPSPDGSAVVLEDDPSRTATGLMHVSAHDAAAFVAFDRRVRTLGRFLDELAKTT